MLTRRELIGFALAPGAVPAILVLAGGLGWAFGASTNTWSQAFASALIVAIYAYLASALLGLPIYGFMRSRKWLRWWHCVAGGVVVGFLASAVLFPLFGLFVVAIAPAFLGIGGISGFVYWLLTRCDLRSNFSSSGPATSARRST